MKVWYLVIAVTLISPTVAWASDFMERVQERMEFYAMIEEQAKRDHLPSEGRLAELSGRYAEVAHLGT